MWFSFEVLTFGLTIYSWVDFWVDDLLSGVGTLQEAFVLQDDLNKTLNKNRLPQRKWSSSETQLVTRLPKDLQEAGKAFEITKWILLSDVSKHFDPIGLKAPVFVVAKVIIQSC